MKSTSGLQGKKALSSMVPETNVPRMTTSTIMQVEEIEEIEIIERFIPRERPQKAKQKYPKYENSGYNPFNQHEKEPVKDRMEIFHCETVLGRSRGASHKNDFPSSVLPVVQEENAERKKVSQIIPASKVTGYYCNRNKPVTKRLLRPLGLSTKHIPTKPSSVLAKPKYVNKAAEPSSPSTKVSMAGQITAKISSFQAGINLCQNSDESCDKKKSTKSDMYSSTAARYTSSYKNN